MHRSTPWIPDSPTGPSIAIVDRSSRNSEVIHAGIYYPLESLKMRYCVRGRELMYERCQRLGIPHKKTSKVN